ncbi:ribosome-inactivating family protein [Spiroplasma endosymbiont of Cantharis rufa]|uniref:ribosome-inactivating family protein n=1 Tax=Spiroplasma endosymbiont of Cantharis rufa TaxID=3066279 RepID=UPI0030D092ED
MIKLLSLIGALTISVGSGIAVSPIIEKNINQENISQYAKEIYTETLLISNYKNEINKIANNLLSNKIVSKENQKNNDNKDMLVIDGNNNEYFTLSVIDDDNELKEAKVDLVISAQNLYLEGFVSNNTYHHFSDSQIKTVKNYKSNDLKYSGNYNSLIGSNQMTVTSQSIHNTIKVLEKFDGDKPISIQKQLVQIIMITSESLRFFSIRNASSNILTSNFTPEWQKEIKPLLLNWNKYSKEFHENNQTNAKKFIRILNRKSSY